jgi:hypothetical protein
MEKIIISNRKGFELMKNVGISIGVIALGCFIIHAIINHVNKKKIDDAISMTNNNSEPSIKFRKSSIRDNL